MGPYTNVTDVATELGRPITEPAEQQQIEAWIKRVESRIRGRIPNLDTLAAEPPYLDTLLLVVAAIVARKVHNPEGMRSERVDDYYYDRGSQPADLWPTDAEWAELAPALKSGAFSTRPSFEPDRVPWPWV